MYSLLKSSPKVIRASFALSVLYALVAVAICVFPGHFSWLLRYVGGLEIPLALVSLACCFIAIFGKQRTIIRRLTMVLLILAAVGTFEMYLHFWGFLKEANQFGNPYLDYDKYRPAFSIAIPLVWALALTSRQVREWIRH